MPEALTTTTKTADYMGRLVVTPATDARDHMARGCLAGDRDYLGRPLIGGGTQGVAPSTAHVDHLDPDHVVAGGMVSVIVNGSGFQPAVVVEVVGVGTSSNQSWISANQVQTNYLFPQTVGVYQVGVRNPGEALSNTVPFTVT